MTSPESEPSAAFPEMPLFAAGFPETKPIDEYTRYEPESREVFFSVPGAFGQDTRGFRVPYENLLRMRAGLERVKEHYRNILNYVEDLSSTRPPFNDDASISFTNKLNSIAKGDPNSLDVTVRGMMKWVDDFQRALVEAEQNYRKIDEENRMR